MTLKPCPFCGNPPDANDPTTFMMNQGDKWGFVYCGCTEVRTNYKQAEHWRERAIEAWNERAEGTELKRLQEEAYERAAKLCEEYPVDVFKALLTARIAADIRALREPK